MAEPCPAEISDEQKERLQKWSDGWYVMRYLNIGQEISDGKTMLLETCVACRANRVKACAACIGIHERLDLTEKFCARKGLRLRFDR